MHPTHVTLLRWRLQLYRSRATRAQIGDPTPPIIPAASWESRSILSTFIINKYQLYRKNYILSYISSLHFFVENKLLIIIFTCSSAPSNDGPRWPLSGLAFPRGTLAWDSCRAPALPIHPPRQSGFVPAYLLRSLEHLCPLECSGPSTFVACACGLDASSRVVVAVSATHDQRPTSTSSLSTQRWHALCAIVS
jgi:hypothetical protein